MQRRELYIFSPEDAGDGAHSYSRMIRLSGSEDPATGSAAGPLGSYLAHHAVVPPEETSRIVNRQGVRMNRPSRLYIDIGVEGDEITRVRIGGVSVVVGEGTLTV